jgi:hypothetical protein
MKRDYMRNIFTLGLIKKKIIIVLIITVTAISLSISIIHDYERELQSIEIYLKDGRLIESENYWENGNFISYEKYGVIIKINKNIVKEIKSLDPKETSNKISLKGSLLKEKKKKYNSYLSIIITEDNRTIRADKTWFNDYNIGYTKGGIKYYIEEDNINQFIRTKMSLTKIVSILKIWFNHIKNSIKFKLNNYF